MHMLAILITMTAVHQHIVRASDVCGLLRVNHTEPVNGTYEVGSQTRLKCMDGYVRKAGTSNLYRCTKMEKNTTWTNRLPLECIPDPKKPVPTSTETQRPNQHFRSSTTERTETLHLTNPSTATGYKTLTTTNKVVTTETRRTTIQSTLTGTTKEAWSNATTNEIISSTSSSFTSREYMTTTSSQTLSSSVTTETVTASVISPINNEAISEASSGGSTTTVTGVTSIIIICLVVTVILLWRRSRHRGNSTNSPNQTVVYTSIPVPVCASEHCLDEPSTEANESSTDSVNDTNQTQTGSVHSPAQCDKLLPQEGLQP